MKMTPRRTERRTDALTKERIVETAIEILDAEGEGGLTFRALATRLMTGSGALYWHVASKDDLLAAATDRIVSRALTEVSAVVGPREAIRTIAHQIFDAVDLHPWIGAQLSREVTQSATLQIFEGIGGRLQAMGVPKRARFDAWSALVNYILGVAGQNAANARNQTSERDRVAFLTSVASRWTQLDPEGYPFLREVAEQLPAHDDREQFLAGIDLILAGISTIREATSHG